MSDLYNDAVDVKFKNFLIDLIMLHEGLIEKSDNEKLKTEMKYKPFIPENHETTPQQD